MATGRRRLINLVQNTKKVFKDLNMQIFMSYFILAITGLLMIYTAGSYEALAAGLSANYFLIRQSIFALLGFGVLLFLLFTNIEIFRKKGILGSMLAIVTLLLLYVLIAGDVINGAKGWIDLGFASIQPIEFAKPVLVLLLAHYLSLNQDIIRKAGLWRGLMASKVLPFFCGLWLIIPIFLPDIGGFSLLTAIMLFMILGSGIKVKWSAYVMAVAVAVYAAGRGLLGVIDLSALAERNYQVRRLTAFIDPFADALGSGLQLVNSYYALANGGLFGLGIGQSMQKTGFLPEAETDFIVAIIGEEFGFLVLIGILAIYFFLTFYLYYRAQKMQTTYLQLILIGVATYFFSQATINLGAVLGLLPITGITFPFMSYGGSSIMVTSIMVGLALSALRRDNRIRRGEAVPNQTFAKQKTLKKQSNSFA